jgi:hypothetical protein
LDKQLTTVGAMQPFTSEKIRLISGAQRCGAFSMIGHANFARKELGVQHSDCQCPDAASRDEAEPSVLLVDLALAWCHRHLKGRRKVRQA